MKTEIRCYAIRRNGSKVRVLVNACSLGEAKAFAVPLTKIVYPGWPIEEVTVTRFRGSSRGLPRSFVLDNLM